MDTFLSPRAFVSPRKSLIAVGVACALLLAALLIDPTVSPPQPDGAGSLTPLQSNMELDSPSSTAPKLR